MADTHRALDLNEQILIETRLANDGPSLVLAYLFWFFLGIVSAHRFYLGRPGTAVLQILTFFIGIGFLWLLVDVFLIPGLARDKRDRMRSRMIAERLAALPPAAATPLPPAA
ncbi:TM2 domain-containing protein [Azorhizobium doebereinerae]|uniref:TM2 domain-containing protein n=1 Tax=Azorhizobium doebereinerae TaxID=281091 RepID=UPI0003FA9D1F|nr:TM2 domain-containing protein [Azorhizobium doebereinerae]